VSEFDVGTSRVRRPTPTRAVESWKKVGKGMEGKGVESNLEVISQQVRADTGRNHCIAVRKIGRAEIRNWRLLDMSEPFLGWDTSQLCCVNRPIK